jgi:hypothetical protein
VRNRLATIAEHSYNWRLPVSPEISTLIIFKSHDSPNQNYPAVISRTAILLRKLRIRLRAGVG